MKVRTLVANQSKEKIDKSYTQSKSISIYCQTKDEKIFKILFDNTLSDSDWENAIDKFMGIMIDNYSHYPSDKLSSKINSKKKTICAIINKDTKEWIFLDDSQMIHISIKKD